MAKPLLAIGAGATLAASLGTVLFYYTQVKPAKKKANELPPVPDPDDTSVFEGHIWRYTPDKPISEYGDNWGITPEEWIPYFQVLEDISGIPGSARIFSLIAYGESRWVADAHNDDASEIDNGSGGGSRPSYERAKDKFPTLKYGEEAANFGSGGLFAMLGPIYLWTGAVFGKRYAPLLDHRPETMFDPRLAGFAAIVFLRNLIRNRDVRDLVDIKVGWGRPTRLSKNGRATEAYENARTKFWAQSVEAGISLEDRNTLPPKLDISGYPGVLEVYERMIAL